MGRPTTAIGMSHRDHVVDDQCYHHKTDDKSDLLWKNTDGSMVVWRMDGIIRMAMTVFWPFVEWSLV